jgi:hypothetical protein
LRGTVAVSGLLSAGCTGFRSYFPLEVGKSWTYHVRAGLAVTVDEARVTRRLSVAGVPGCEIGGPLGFSRLAWKGGTLVADSLPNTRFLPALPLLAPGDPATAHDAEVTKGQGLRKPVRTWEGAVETMGKQLPGSAELYQEEASVTLGVRRYPALKTTLRLSTAGKKIELVTWYVDGMGPLRQEQQTNGLQDVGMEYLGGS